MVTFISTMLKIKKPSKKIIIIAASSLLIGGATLFALEKQQVIDLYSNGSKTEVEPPLPENKVSLDPPSEDEKRAGDEKKDEIVENKKDSGVDDQSASKNVTVIITDAGQYDGIIEVRSFIPDHYQDGTCTITFTKGASKVSKDTPAYRDASTTICTNPLFKKSQFSATGKWQVAVTYKSKDGRANGTSETKTININ